MFPFTKYDLILTYSSVGLVDCLLVITAIFLTVMLQHTGMSGSIMKCVERSWY